MFKLANANTILISCTLSACAHSRIELVETAPVETSLDHTDLREAYVVWPQLIDRAKRNIDFGEFYASIGGRLEPVVASIERATRRGVHVRMLFDQLFYAKDPTGVDRLSRIAGVEVRRIDLKKRTGGIQHAKYFIVDGEQLYLGSQNF